MALSAFDSFCRGLKRGRFPDLQDRDNLWKLLVVLTARKACHLIRDEQRLKRGGGQTAGTAQELEQAVGQEPSPEFAAELAENCQRLLDLLGDDDLRTVALNKMEGYTTEEIASQLNCAPRTVERKLRLIRRRLGERVSAMNSDDALPLSLEQKVDQVCTRFEAAWKAGTQPRIEDYFADLADGEKRDAA